MGWVSNYSPDKLALIVDIEREVQVAHARSLAIRRAKIQKPDLAWQIDTDVIVEPNAETTASLCLDDARRGYGAVTSPGLSSEGILEVSYDRSKVRWSDTEPFALTKSWAGFFSMSRRCFLDLEPLGYVHSISNQRIDSYCASFPYMPCPNCGKEIEGMGEDVALDRQIFKSGHQLAADPRITTTHLKIAGLKSLRPGMSVHEPEVAS